MRLLCIALLALYAVPGSATQPCEVERNILEKTNNTIAEGLTRLLELRTTLVSEQENREGLLTNNLKNAELRMLGASQTLLQESQLLQLLADSRPQLQRLGEAVPRLTVFERLPEQPSVAGALMQILTIERAALDSEAVGDLQTLIQVVRALEKTSRNWRALVGNDPPTSLKSTLERVSFIYQALTETVTQGPVTIAQGKQLMNEAQTAVANSLAFSHSKETELSNLERHLSSLKQNLPAQKATLNACTRRAQFGE